jgi:hypothetical protein
MEKKFYNGLISFITKGQGALDHEVGELVGENFMVGQILEELFKKKGKAYTMDGRKCSKPSSPNWETMVCYGFQAQQMCSHC